MIANILHFGQEHVDRFHLLREAGYSLRRYERILEFRNALQSDIDLDAVSITEFEEPAISELIVRTARSYSSAPLVLFRTKSVILFPPSDKLSAAMHPDSNLDFDLVVSVTAPAQTWLAEIDALIARSRELLKESRRTREQSRRLQQEAAEVIEQTRFESERAAIECAQNAVIGEAAGFVADRVLVCTDCGRNFVFTSGEQVYFRSRNFFNDPKHCKSCRSIRRNEPIRVRPETAVTCAECGASTTIPFKPIHGRPVFCRACFDKHRVAV